VSPWLVSGVMFVSFVLGSMNERAAAERRRRRRRVLLELLKDGPAVGLDLVKRSNGVLGRGTVYVQLLRAEEQGLVQSDPVADGDGRRRYTITMYGKHTLESLTRFEETPTL
jgi:DNA-binding PadR family transcriptional regulator